MKAKKRSDAKVDEQSAGRLAAPLPCGCGGPNERWLEHAEGATMQDDHREGLILAGGIFYGNWTICLFHLAHVCQHLGLFPFDDYQDGIEAVNQAWDRRYDYDDVKAENPDLFPADDVEGDDDDDDDDKDQKRWSAEHKRSVNLIISFLIVC